MTRKIVQRTELAAIVLAALCMVCTACNMGSVMEAVNDALTTSVAGAWENEHIDGTAVKYVFTGTEWTGSTKASSADSFTNSAQGTYTLNGTTVTFTVTDRYDNGSWVADTTSLKNRQFRMMLTNATTLTDQREITDSYANVFIMTRTFIKDGCGTTVYTPKQIYNPDRPKPGDSAYNDTTPSMVTPPPVEETPATRAIVKLNMLWLENGPAMINDEISPQDAIDWSNSFEAVFIKKGENPQNYNFNYATINNSAEVIVPVGTYDIIVLAGLDINTPFKYLLASGYIVDKGLVEGDNLVTIALQSIDVAISLPSIARFGETITGSIIVNIKNPFVRPGGNVSIRSDTNGFSEFSMYGSETIEDGLYTYILSGTTPNTGTAGMGLAKVHIGTWGESGLWGGLSWTISDGFDGSNSPNSYTTNRFWKRIYLGPSS